MQLQEMRSEIKNVRIKVKPLLCQEHNMDLNFYCETCEQLVCSFLASNFQEMNLSITIDGQHIKGSPFSVQVRQYSALD